MPALPRPTRTGEIVLAAAEVFGRFGLRRTQMADIAAAAGTALGTLYRYSRSKEALFAAVLRHALGNPVAEVEAALSTAPTRTALEQHVAQFVRARDFTPALRDAIAAPPPQHAAAELERVVGELFDVMNRFALAICILDVSSREWPELAVIYDREVRRVTLDRIARYLESRCAQGLFVPPPDIGATALFVLELCGEFTRGRKHSSRERQYASDEVARATVLHIVSRTLLDRP